MRIELEILLKALGLILAAAGLVIVYMAPKIVDKNKLDEKKQIDPDRTAMLTEEEKKKFKRESAILDIKLRGLFLAVPGFIIILFMFRI